MAYTSIKYIDGAMLQRIYVVNDILYLLILFCYVANMTTMTFTCIITDNDFLENDIVFFYMNNIE